MADVADSSTRVVDGCQIEFWPRTSRSFDRDRPVRSAGRQTAFAAGLHVEIELPDLGIVEQRLPGLHALLRAAFPDGLEEDFVRDEPLGGDRNPQVRSEIRPERVDAVAAETIDMEPLPALVLVRGHQELV